MRSLERFSLPCSVRYTGLAGRNTARTRYGDVRHALGRCVLLLCVALLLSSVALGDESAERVNKAKLLVARLAAGQFDEAIEPFTGKMKRGLPASRLKQIWDGLLKQHGALRRACPMKTMSASMFSLRSG